MLRRPEDIRVELSLNNEQVRALVRNLQKTEYFTFTFFSFRALTKIINKYYELPSYQIALEHKQLVDSLMHPSFKGSLAAADPAPGLLGLLRLLPASLVLSNESLTEGQ